MINALEDSSIQIAYNNQENCNQVYYNGQKMENIPFGITREDIEEENEYMQMLSENNLQYKYQGFFSKIKNIFFRKKEPLILEEGDEQEQITENFEQEHEQAPIGKTNQKTNEWDLTQEDKKCINEGAIKIASKHINGEQISHERSNIESKQEENILS